MKTMQLCVSFVNVQIIKFQIHEFFINFLKCVDSNLLKKTKQNTKNNKKKSFNVEFCGGCGGFCLQSVLGWHC